MLISDAGGSGSISNSAPPACIAGDPKVKEAVEQTVAATEFGQPNDGAQAAYQIRETLARTDLTQDQKDEYLAAVVQMAGGQSTFCGSVDERTADKLLHGLNDIGTAWTDPATPELRAEVTAGIARASPMAGSTPTISMAWSPSRAVTVRASCWPRCATGRRWRL